MALLEVKVNKGLRQAEVTVEVKDHAGVSQFLPADRDFVEKEGGKFWLPVSVIRFDPGKKLVVVGLPVETDSGAHAVTVRTDQLKNFTEVLT